MYVSKLALCGPAEHAHGGMGGMGVSVVAETTRPMPSAPPTPAALAAIAEAQPIFSGRPSNLETLAIFFLERVNYHAAVD